MCIYRERCVYMLTPRSVAEPHVYNAETADACDTRQSEQRPGRPGATRVGDKCVTAHLMWATATTRVRPIPPLLLGVAATDRYVFVCVGGYTLSWLRWCVLQFLSLRRVCVCFAVMHATAQTCWPTCVLSTFGVGMLTHAHQPHSH